MTGTDRDVAAASDTTHGTADPLLDAPVVPTAAESRNRRRNLALLKAGVSAVTARAGSSLTTLLMMPLLAGILGVEAFGVLLTLTATSALLLLGNLGIASGLVSRLAANSGDADRVRSVLSSAYAVVIAASGVGLVLAVLLSMLLPWASWTSAAGVPAADIRLCAFLALAGSALQMTMTLGQQIELSQQRGHAAAWWLGAANVGAPVMATVLAGLTGDLRWAVAGLAFTPPLVMAVQTAGVLARLPKAVRPTRHAVSWRVARELLASGGHFTGLALLGAIAFQLDILVVSSFLGSEAAAVYGVTSRLFLLVSATLQIAVTQLWSAFADARRHGDVEWIRRTLVRSSIACAAVGLGASATLLVAGAPLIRLWVGEDLVPPVSLLLAAAVWTALGSAAAPMVFYLNGSEKERQQFLVSIPMAVANVALSIWWVQVMGISGVVWASCVAWGLFVALPLVVITRRTLADQAQDAVERRVEAGPTAPQASEPAPAEADWLAVDRPRRASPWGPAGEESGYRPDIDGLRAVAVLAVIGYHFFPGFFPGGFVGVDVFFVVSGFLITGLMARRIRLGTFTMLDFYGRRVRRIFPALGVVLVATLVVGWLVLFAEEFRELAVQTATGSFFVANFHFMQEASYFDAGAYTKPLLHLWSLAIEEQFYLVWPVVLVLALRRGRRVALVVVAAITVVSLGFNFYFAATDVAAAYYSPLSRFWQLSAGALLALTPLAAGMRRQAAATAMSFVGLLLIAFGVLTFSSGLPYPGAYGLAPVLGTLLVMVAGRASLLNRGPLSWRLAVGIGLISYPLYLWHWPLISFATIVGRQFPSIPVRLALVAIAFALAVATYRLVERPLRFRVSVKGALRPLAAGLATVGFVGVLVATPVGPTSANPDSPSGSLSSLQNWSFEENALCNDRYPFDDKVGGWWFCVTNADQDPDILLIGDSTANELYPGVVDAFDDRTVLSIGTCPPTQGIRIEPLAPAPGNPCFEERSIEQERFMDSTIADLAAPWVVIHTIWPRFDDDGTWIDGAGNPAGSIVDLEAAASDDVSDLDALLNGLTRRIESVEAAGGRVVLVGPKPQIDYDVALCFPRPFNESVQSCTVDAEEQQDAVDSFLEIATEVQARTAATSATGQAVVSVFDQSPVYCDPEECSLVIGDRPLMRDQVHLSVTGSELVGRELADWALVNAPGLARP